MSLATSTYIEDAPQLRIENEKRARRTKNNEVERVRQLLGRLVKFSEATQRAVERRLSMTSGSLSRVLNGHVDLRVEHVVEVCRVIDFPVEWFWQAAYPRHGELTKRNAFILRLLQQTSPLGRVSAPKPKPSKRKPRRRTATEETEDLEAEPIEQAVAAVDPIKALLRRLKEGVIPLIEQQREPSQRTAMLALLEFDLRGAFEVLGNLDIELREIRRSCTELHKIARKLRPRGKPPHRPPVLPTGEQKKAVLDALQERGAVGMSELCHATGFGMSKLMRILNVLREQGSVDRSGTTSGTRYRSTAPGKRRR